MIPFILGLASSICTAVASIGPAVSSLVATYGPVLSKLLSEIAPIAKALSEFANVFLQLVGVLKPGETVEDIGERSLQAAEQGIALDSAEDFDAYMESLRTLELDPDQAANRSLAEKLVAGIAVCSVGLERIFPIVVHNNLPGLWLLPIANPTYFTPERMQSLLTTGSLTGDVLGYLEKRLSADERKAFEDSLGAGKETPYEALDLGSERWANISQMSKGE